MTSLFFRLGDTHFPGFVRFKSKVFYILHAAALCRGRMKNPSLTRKLIQFLSATSLAAAVTVGAQPDTSTTKSRAPRARPQVIYHLPPASNYAATLHSQAKSQNNELPIDSSMPTSVQTLHANANTDAAQQPAASQPPHQRQLKPRARSNRAQGRPHSFGKSSGRGNGHGNHSHKK